MIVQIHSFVLFDDSALKNFICVFIADVCTLLIVDRILPTNTATTADPSRSLVVNHGVCGIGTHVALLIEVRNVRYKRVLVVLVWVIFCKRLAE